MLKARKSFDAEKKLIFALYGGAKGGIDVAQLGAVLSKVFFPNSVFSFNPYLDSTPFFRNSEFVSIDACVLSSSVNDLFLMNSLQQKQSKVNCLIQVTLVMRGLCGFKDCIC